MLEDLPEYIINHRLNKEGERIYYVKWMGCDICDNTWETEEKLRTEWPTTLAEYQRQLKSGKRHSPLKHTNTAEVYAYTASVDNWEEAVQEIAYVEKSKIPGYTVFVNWKNGYKSIHHSTEVYVKCPLKMIEYFEKFAQFNEIFSDE